MNLELIDKTALVSGSTKGIGFAIATQLAAEGARVIVNGRSDNTVNSALEEIRETRPEAKVEGFAGDLATATATEDLVRLFPAVDILVNNLGIFEPKPFDEIADQEWLRFFEVNVLTGVRLSRAYLPGMKERRWGRVLNITSIAVKQPIDGLMLSNTLRAAVTGFARTLANEVARFNITVNNIMPGYTRTDRVEQLARAASEKTGSSLEDAYAKWEREIPLGRLGEPREFAALAAFLASERASYITGSSIAVDGGWIRSIL